MREEDAVDRTCRLPRQCCENIGVSSMQRAARCFTVKQKGGGVGGGGKA